VHTSEVELTENNVRGIAVHIASRVARIGGADDVLVSRTVKGLVAGSGIKFEDFGASSGMRLRISSASFLLAPSGVSPLRVDSRGGSIIWRAQEDSSLLPDIARRHETTGPGFRTGCAC
jgi:hypothetical protein